MTFQNVYLQPKHELQWDKIVVTSNCQTLDLILLRTRAKITQETFA